MNKKGQELNPVGVLMAIVGAIIGLILSGQMGAGIVMRIITVAITAIACYFIASNISNG